MHTIFDDGSESVFAPPRDNGAAAFRDAADEMGYSDLMRYAVEHELAHHISAHARGLPHSLVVWADAHDSWSSFHGADWPMRAEDEEHLANRLQRFMNLGAKDSFGCLHGVYGSRLGQVASDLLAVARPWLCLRKDTPSVSLQSELPAIASAIPSARTRASTRR